VVVSLAEVARRAKVSVATASRVLSGSSYPVTDELRKRVLDAARQFHYVPNANARALQNRESTAIGVIVGDVRDPYFAEIVHSIQQVVDEHGRLLYICSSHRDPAREIEYVKLLRSQSVSAMIMAGSGITDSEYVDELEIQINAFRESGGIVASIGRHMIRSRTVLPDNFGGAAMLGGALVDLGHRRFGVINGPPSLTSTAERFGGLMKAWRAAGIGEADVAVVESDYSWEGGTEAAGRLIGQQSDLTCIVALNDLMALGAQRHLQRNGLGVPGDISVAGFDDVVSATEAQPALTTVRIHLPEMSRRVAEIALAGKKELPEEMEDVFAATLMMRESTSRPRRAKTIRLKPARPRS
jgi:LacI family transcriptional regulator